jgi:hypothetical protein
MGARQRRDNGDISSMISNYDNKIIIRRSKNEKKLPGLPQKPSAMAG